MTAVTTDGARIGVEQRDHSGCSFPFLLVTVTPSLSANPTGDSPTHRGEAAVAPTVGAEPAPTTRGTAE